MGGRVAEEIVFGDVTNGARGDIKMATAIARRMVCEWGMSEKMGMVEYGEHEDYVFSDRDISAPATTAKRPPKRSIAKCASSLDEAYQSAKNILTANRDKLDIDRQSVARIRNSRRLADRRYRQARPYAQPAAGIAPRGGERWSRRNRPSRSLSPLTSLLLFPAPSAAPQRSL